MPERPDSFQRLDALFSAAMIAHEAIFEMRRELIAGCRNDSRHGPLLEESAQIVISKLPTLAANARHLSDRWAEEILLDPEEAKRTQTEFEAELRRIEPAIRLLLGRQREIAARLRSDLTC